MKNLMKLNRQLVIIVILAEVNPSPETIAALTKMAQESQNPSQSIVFNNYVYFPAANGDVESRGTLRVKFGYCRSTQLSLISGVNEQAQQYEPFRIDLVDNGGEADEPGCLEPGCCMWCQILAESLRPMTSISLLIQGAYDSHQLIRLTVRQNYRQSNILRLVFFIVMALGIFFFGPIVQILGYIPCVSGFLKGTAGILIFIGAVVVSIPLFVVTFTLDWMRYHPTIGGAVIAVAALSLFWMSRSSGQVNA